MLLQMLIQIILEIKTVLCINQLYLLFDQWPMSLYNIHLYAEFLFHMKLSTEKNA
jgi:hypothetical protein